MAREYLDWSTFDTPSSAIDLLSNTIRKGIDYDAFGERKVWQAMVLSPPQRIANTAASGLGVPVKEGVNINSPMFRFKARLLGENSPHLSLPNPCDMSVNSDPRFVESVVELHINVVFCKTGTADPPNNGDLILVELEQNDISYNLQQATFVKTIARNVSSEPLFGTKGCAVTFDVFENENLYIDSPLPIGQGKTDFIPVGENIIISKPMVSFITAMRDILTKEQISVVYITSGVRTPEAQARAISTKRSLHKCEGGITGKPSSGSPCWPIYKLYAQKTLISEVLRAPNSIQQMANVLQNQVSNSKFLSRHMRGMGIDLRTRNLHESQIELIKDTAKSLGGNAQYEGDPPHLHIGIPAGFKSGGSSVADNSSTQNESAASETTS
jgi:hypothetical protein